MPSQYGTDPIGIEEQQAILDELELLREDAKLTPAQRDAAVDDLIALVGGVDGVLQAPAKADATYFCAITGNGRDAERAAAPAARPLDLNPGRPGRSRPAR